MASTFPAAGHHRPLTDTKYTVLFGDRSTCVCEQLAQGCYLKAEQPEVERATVESQVQYACIRKASYIHT